MREWNSTSQSRPIQIHPERYQSFEHESSDIAVWGLSAHVYCICVFVTNENPYFCHLDSASGRSHGLLSHLNPEAELFPKGQRLGSEIRVAFFLLHDTKRDWPAHDSSTK